MALRSVVEDAGKEDAEGDEKLIRTARKLVSEIA